MQIPMLYFINFLKFFQNVNEALLMDIDAINVALLDDEAKIDHKILRNHVLTFRRGYKWRQ